ncbi:hypothetical protein D3C77_317650 [compost metagenome]
MDHPVVIQRAFVVLVGARGDLSTIQPELRVLAERRFAARDCLRAREELGVLVLVEQTELVEADYLIAQLGCSLDALLCRGIRERFASTDTVPCETNPEGVAEDFDPTG